MSVLTRRVDFVKNFQLELSKHFLKYYFDKLCYLGQCSVAMERHYGCGNSWKGKHLIGAALNSEV